MDRAAYDRDALTMMARMAGGGPIHDAKACEIRAQNIFFGAVTRMRQAIVAVNGLSGVITLNPESFENFVHDEWPDETSWDAKIAAFEP